MPELGDLYHQVPLAKTDLSLQTEQNWHSKLNIERSETHHKSNFVKSLEEAEENKNDEEKDICEENDGKISISDTQKLDQEVKLWSDFLRSRFHPKTNVVMGKSSLIKIIVEVFV